MINPTYAVLLIGSGTVTLFLAGLAWRGRSASGSTAFQAMMLSLTIWCWGYAWFWMASTENVQKLALGLAFIGVVICTPAFLVMAIQFAGRGHWLSARVYTLLSVTPILTLLINWTDAYHNLFYGGRDITDPVNLLDGGPWFWFYVFYSHLLTLGGMLMIGWIFVTNTGLYRRQAGVFLLGMLFPWSSSFMGLGKVAFLPSLDITPIAFSVTGMLFAYGFFSHHILDLAPFGRDALVENLEDGIVVMDLHGRVVDLNPTALSLVSPGVENPIGQTVETVFFDWKDYIAAVGFREGRLELKLDRPPFSTLDVRFLPLKDRHGQVVGQVATWRDISARKQVEEQLRVFFHAVEQNPTAIVITDPSGHIEYVNPRLMQLTGYALEEIHGKTPKIFKSGETDTDLYSDLWKKVKAGQVWQGQILNRKKNGETYWVHEMIAPVLDNKGTVTHFVAMQEDITDRVRAELELSDVNLRLQAKLAEIESLHDQLREEAIRDGLTRLFNRRYMEETLDREISRFERESQPISVVMMDVDLFKVINDKYGHQAGDAVLQTLGTMLLENTRISDIACRYGGDEMLVVMPGAIQEVAIARAEEWRAAFSMMEFSFGDKTIRTTLSLGVASFPDQAQNPIELLNAADKALYFAKIKRNQVQPYEPSTMGRGQYRSDDIR